MRGLVQSAQRDQKRHDAASRVDAPVAGLPPAGEGNPRARPAVSAVASLRRERPSLRATRVRAASGARPRSNHWASPQSSCTAHKPAAAGSSSVAATAVAHPVPIARLEAALQRSINRSLSQSWPPPPSAEHRRAPPRHLTSAQVASSCTVPRTSSSCPLSTSARHRPAPRVAHRQRRQGVVQPMWRLEDHEPGLPVDPLQRHLCSAPLPARTHQNSASVPTKPATCSAAASAEGPGSGDTRSPLASTTAATRAAPGSLTAGVPASVRSATAHRSAAPPPPHRRARARCAHAG